jgi:thiamine biosynthesis lipoprotein
MTVWWDASRLPIEKDVNRMLLDNKLAIQKTHTAMGTIMTHKAFGLHAAKGLEAVCSEVERIEICLSRFLPGSEISRVNTSAGSKSEKVSLETFYLLLKALDFSHTCPGCFDVSIGPLVDLWNMSRRSLIQPDDVRLRQALSLVDFRDVIMDPIQITAGLRKLGQSIDLGGIGKGFAGDRIVEIYKEFDIISGYSNLGGNVVALGTKPDGSPWRIGIQHPRQEDRLVGLVSVIDQSVVTSGDYQRCFFDNQGIRHHHILDPTNGYPADSGLISVSVVSESSLEADALSTILFIAGLEKGIEFLKSFPRSEAIFVDTDLKVYLTKGLKCRFQADMGTNVTILS